MLSGRSGKLRAGHRRRNRSQRRIHGVWKQEWVCLCAGCLGRLGNWLLRVLVLRRSRCTLVGRGVCAAEVDLPGTGVLDFVACGRGLALVCRMVGELRPVGRHPWMEVIILWRPVRVLLLLSAVWCFALVLNLRGPLCCQGPGLPPEPGKTLEEDWGVARRLRISGTMLCVSRPGGRRPVPRWGSTSTRSRNRTGFLAWLALVVSPCQALSQSLHGVEAWSLALAGRNNFSWRSLSKSCFGCISPNP